ncbi:MAG: hypothetical protein AAFY47_08155, partial [Pseudomonadota bacterium]
QRAAPLSGAPNAQAVKSKPVKPESVKRGRNPGMWLAALLVLLGVVMGVAWIDGGEEPIRPIAQPVAVPAGEGSS